MKGYLNRWGLVMLLCSGVNAYAQVNVRDEFSGGLDPGLPWSWTVIAPNPDACDYWNSEDPSRYRFQDDLLVIDFHPWNSTYDQWNYANNFLNLPVRGFGDGWAIETTVTLNLNGNIPGAYTQTGLILMKDMDNYYTVMLLVDPNASPIRFWVSTAQEINRSYGYGGASAGFWDDGQNSSTCGLRIEDAGLVDGVRKVNIKIKRQGIDDDWVAIWPSPMDVPQIVSDIVQNGGYVGFFNVAGFTADPMPSADFDYIQLEQVFLKTAGDVNNDGCVDDADLLQVLFDFGNGGDGLSSDVNQDCVVDDADLLQVLFSFGSGC